MTFRLILLSDSCNVREDDFFFLKSCETWISNKIIILLLKGFFLFECRGGGRWDKKFDIDFLVYIKHDNLDSGYKMQSSARATLYGPISTLKKNT